MQRQDVPLAASLMVCGDARRQIHAHHALYQSSGKRTLGAGEGAVLRAPGEGTVEKGGELRVRNVAERVVGEDIFLESLATIGGASMLAKCIEQTSRWALLLRRVATTRCWNYLRASVALLEL